MTDPDMRSMTLVEGIRKRPAMYIGSTNLFGYINYFVYPITLLLGCGAKRVAVRIGDAVDVESDALVPVREFHGDLVPFENHDPERPDIRGVVLNALSRSLEVTVRAATGVRTIGYERGIRVRDERGDAVAAPGTMLRFVPDDEVFRVTNVSVTALDCFFRRLSRLHAGVAFTYAFDSKETQYCTTHGLLDLFEAFVAPYQIMHEPIHFSATDGKLELEMVMAYHSWSTDHVVFFVNNGRAVEGGTHETGLKHALRRLPKKLSLPAHFGNGVVAVASMRYPDAVWEGCIKAKIANPELAGMVSRIVVEEVLKWIESRPDVGEQFRNLEVFQFPDAWYE